MSKKVNVETTTATQLQEYFEKYSNVTLRKFAKHTGLNYSLLLKKKKQPIAGEAYDPNSTNWAALAEVVSKNSISLGVLNWFEMNQVEQHNLKIVETNTDAFQVGTKVWLRKENDKYFEIVYRTKTHVVLLLEGTQEPIAWSYNTLLANGPALKPRSAFNNEPLVEVGVAPEVVESVEPEVQPETIPEKPKRVRKPKAKVAPIVEDN